MNFTLGHAVGGTVTRIAVDDDTGAGIQPAHVVRRRTVDHNGCVGKPEGTDALSRVTVDDDFNCVSICAPQPATETVLSECLDLHISEPAINGRLQLFFHNA